MLEFIEHTIGFVCLTSMPTITRAAQHPVLLSSEEELNQNELKTWLRKPCVRKTVENIYTLKIQRLKIIQLEKARFIEVNELKLSQTEFF